MSLDVSGDVTVDGVALPVVLNIHITNPTNVITKTIQDGTSLPDLTFSGSQGRTAIITGYTMNSDDVPTLKGYDDGQPHTVLLPTSIPIIALLTPILVVRSLEEAGRYDYTLTVLEEVDE